jgi:hypothetical protein
MQLRHAPARPAGGANSRIAEIFRAEVAHFQRADYSGGGLEVISKILKDAG